MRREGQHIGLAQAEPLRDRLHRPGKLLRQAAEPARAGDEAQDVRDVIVVGGRRMHQCVGPVAFDEHVVAVLAGLPKVDAQSPPSATSARR